MKTHRFVHEEMGWFIDLPEYLAQGGNKVDLQMVSGADTMLDIIAEKENEVILNIHTDPFDGSDELVLTERCDPILGGGYYHMKKFQNNPVNKDLWLCEVTRFVFGNIPHRIYVKKIPI
jgi:hypothetical protein